MVLYVFGKNFFLERKTLDFDATEKTKKVVWTRLPKVVNFCPYCRGVLYSAISLPFVYVWRLLPHKESKELSHKETMARSKKRGMWIRCISGTVQFPFAVVAIIAENYLTALTHIILGISLIYVFVVLPSRWEETKKILGPPLKKYVWPLIKPIFNYISNYFEEKDNVEKEYKVKNPSIFKAYLHSKHSAICPVVCFIDKADQENLR